MLKTQLVEKMNNLFFPFISAYRESYNTHHVLFRLIEESRKKLSLLELFLWSFRIAKVAAYGFDKNMLCYIYPYLESRKQCVSINNTKITFEEIISGALQRSIVGPILFNIFFNYFFYFI